MNVRTNVHVWQSMQVLQLCPCACASCRVTWTFWQFSDRGQEDGVVGNVNLDYFSGTMEDLRSLCF